MGLELLQVIRESMGFARPEPEDPVHEEALDLVPVVKIALEAGADLVAIERLVRVWGESMRRITEASATFYRAQIEVPLLRSGLSEAQVLQAANEAVAAGIPYVDRALASMYHGQSEHTWMANVVEAVEATLEKAGLHHTVAELPAMCFLDLSGYTQLTEERGDEAAAEMAAVLGGLVQRSANDQRGRPVKWLGDGVMLYFAEPDGAVISALELADRVPAAGLPPPHTGIDAGPVIFQDGDYFGRTVNTAARIASHGGPGQVLVSDSVVRFSQNPAIRFVDIGLVELKGLPHPIRLHRASRSAVLSDLKILPEAMADSNADLRALLETLDPITRDALRRVLIHDQADRDAVSSQLLRYRDGHGDDWAEIIDMLTMHPEERRRVARLLGEIDAEA